MLLYIMLSAFDVAIHNVGAFDVVIHNVWQIPVILFEE